MKIKQFFGRVMLLLTFTCFVLGMVPATDTYAATEEAKEKFRQIVIEMIETGDASKRDVSDLQLTFSEYYPIFEDVTQNECWIAYSCYLNGVAQTSKDENGYIKEFWIYNVSPDFPKHYAEVKKKIAYVQSQMDPKMTDLDKVLWIHDYIDEITYYQKSDENQFVFTSVGPLYYGYSVCAGYADAMEVLLRAVGIESEYVTNSGHGWNAVYIDNELYHVDATWDDTRNKKAGISGCRYFLMRNDDEYRNDPSSPHTNFKYYN